jgi:hypothetical protein
MALILRFRKLAPADRLLLLQAWLLLWGIRLGLWLLPFRTLRPLLAGTTKPERPPGAGRPAAARIGWSVHAASQYVPAATCLAQALAAQTLCRRHGHPAVLRLGVAKGDRGQFKAHAWVISHGRIIIGGRHSPAHFTPLPPLEKL